MTGRAAGTCRGYDVSGYANPIPGRGMGPGWGQGGGWRYRRWGRPSGLPSRARLGAPAAWGYGPGAGPVGPVQELASLRQQAEWLEQQLGQINECLRDLEAEL
jgi:hypothetical protein